MLGKIRLLFTSNSKENMKQFLKYFSIFCIPFILFILFYIWTDVFKVVQHHDRYYTDSDIVWINRAYGSTMTYINQNPQYNYDSFIFGNSRSLYYETDTWEKYLPKGCSCFHFDESEGSVKGVRDKVVYIDKTGGRINNVLLVLDCDLLSKLCQDDSYFLFISPPALVDNENYYVFQKQHFMAFSEIRFQKAFVGYKLFGEYRPYMDEVLMNPHYKDSYINPKTNEFQKIVIEGEINKGVYYNAERISAFINYQKPETISSQLLDAPKILYLKEIRDIFRKHHSSYKIVISPLYDQVKLNRKSLSILFQIFGKENIYDFSGESKWSKDYHNYYEISHYRPVVSAEIMDIIYSKSQPSK